MAKVYHITINQGAAFSMPVYVMDNQGNPKDLSNTNAYSQIRKTYNSANAIDFVTAINELEGEITLNLTKEVTSNIASGRHVYDVYVIYPDALTERIIEGIVTVTPQVTKGF